MKAIFSSKYESEAEACGKRLVAYQIQYEIKHEGDMYVVYANAYVATVEKVVTV